MRVLVIGGGIGGLSAGIALARDGHTVRIIERSADRGTGVGINQPANGLRAFQQLGVLHDILNAGFAYTGQDFRTWRGDRLIVRVSVPTDDGAVPEHCALPRQALLRILTDAAVGAGARIDAPRTVRLLRDRGDGVDVEFNDEQQRADLVVAADGIWSRTRSAVTAETPQDTGAGVWRVVVPRAVERTTLWQGLGTKAGAIPLTDSTMYLLLVTPAHAGLTPEEHVSTLRADLAGYGAVPGAVRDTLDEGHRIHYSPLHEILCQRWSSGRIVLLGDSVHACVPHLTQGAGLAAEDAVVLADELSRLDGRDTAALLTALKRYRDRRMPRVAAVHAASRAVLDAERDIHTEDDLDRYAASLPTVLPGQHRDLAELLTHPL